MSQQTSTSATEHDARVNGIQLHYATWGDQAAAQRAIVLIHGLTVNWTEWEPLGPALAAAGWYVIAPDLRGRGQSAKPPHGYGIPYHANDVLSLCDTLNLSRVAVMGHSLGAFITIFLAALHPTRVSHAVLVDAGGTVPADAYEAVASSVQRIGVVYPSLDAFMEARRKSAVAFAWSPLWERLYRYDVEVWPDGTATSRMPKHAFDEEVAVNAFVRLDAMLPLIKAPTLITRATVGTLAPDRGFILTAEEAARLRDTIPGAQVVEIANVTHYDIALADEFMRVVADFLG